MAVYLKRHRNRFTTAACFGLLAVGCSSRPHLMPTAGADAAATHHVIIAHDGTAATAPVGSLNGAAIPEQFGFITNGTTLQQVVDAVGKYTRVRGSGILYFEYDLPDGSAVLIGPEWPFESDSRIRNVFFYPHATDITLAP